MVWSMIKLQTYFAHDAEPIGPQPLVEDQGGGWDLPTDFTPIFPQRAKIFAQVVS